MPKSFKKEVEPIEETQEQKNNRPWLYKKGQSGNPGGRPVGSISMKTYVKNKLLSMSDEEREEFLEGVDKKVLWEMSEGKPDTKTDITSGGEPLKTVDPTDPIILESLKAIQEKLEHGE